MGSGIDRRLVIYVFSSGLPKRVTEWHIFLVLSSGTGFLRAHGYNTQ